MWKLYKLLEPGIPETLPNSFLDLAHSVFEKVSPTSIPIVMSMMYPKYRLDNGLTLLTLFVKGLKKNNFLRFVQIYRGLTSNG